MNIYHAQNLCNGVFMRLRAAARHAVKNICVGDKTLHPQAQIFFLYLLYKAYGAGF